MRRRWCGCHSALTAAVSACRGAREAIFEELDPLGIPDLEPFEDMESERGLPRVFIELLWAAGAGEAALALCSTHQPP